MVLRPQGATELGVALAAAAVPAFMAMSLLAECHRWSKRALGELTERTVSSRSEMTLQAALGLSQMFTRGNSEEVRHALERSLAVAQELGDAASQVQLLARLQIFHERIGDFVVSLDYAHRSAAVAETIDDPTARATANSLVGLCSHLTGDQAKDAFCWKLRSPAGCNPRRPARSTPASTMPTAPASRWLERSGCRGTRRRPSSWLNAPWTTPASWTIL